MKSEIKCIWNKRGREQKGQEMIRFKVLRSAFGDRGFMENGMYLS